MSVGEGYLKVNDIMIIVRPKYYKEVCVLKKIRGDFKKIKEV